MLAFVCLMLCFGACVWVVWVLLLFVVFVLGCVRLVTSVVDLSCCLVLLIMLCLFLDLWMRI